jgi:hypothetical protein
VLVLKRIIMGFGEGLWRFLPWALMFMIAGVNLEALTYVAVLGFAFAGASIVLLIMAAIHLLIPPR